MHCNDLFCNSRIYLAEGDFPFLPALAVIPGTVMSQSVNSFPSVFMVSSHVYGVCGLVLKDNTSSESHPGYIECVRQ